MQTERRRVLFIVNPVSGGKDKSSVVEQIKKQLSKEIFAEFLYWKTPEGKNEFIKRIKEDHTIDWVVAVGGDGTINQVAGAMMGSDKTMGIIPVGSGNGLARHLGIPLNVAAAVKLINDGKIKRIDACKVNDICFFCTSGVGFDALISQLFAQSKTRGFFTYFQLTLREFMAYAPKQYQLYLDDTKIDRTAFLITFANASQYGNNAFIAPQADIADGYIDVCVLKPFHWWQAVGIGARMFNKTINKSPFLEMHRAKKIRVIRSSDGPVHFDGDPVNLARELTYEVIPSAIKVLVK